MSSLFEAKPRWAGAPPVCVGINLPAFETRRAMKAFLDKLCGSAAIHWRCRFCGHWHFWSFGASTNNSSPGNHTIPERILYEKEHQATTTAVLHR